MFFCLFCFSLGQYLLPNICLSRTRTAVAKYCWIRRFTMAIVTPPSLKLLSFEKPVPDFVDPASMFWCRTRGSRGESQARISDRSWWTIKWFDTLLKLLLRLLVLLLKESAQVEEPESPEVVVKRLSSRDVSILRLLGCGWDISIPLFFGCGWDISVLRRSRWYRRESAVGVLAMARNQRKRGIHDNGAALLLRPMFALVATGLAWTMATNTRSQLPCREETPRESRNERAYQLSTLRSIACKTSHLTKQVTARPTHHPYASKKSFQLGNSRFCRGFPNQTSKLFKAKS